MIYLCSPECLAQWRSLDRETALATLLGDAEQAAMMLAYTRRRDAESDAANEVWRVALTPVDPPNCGCVRNKTTGHLLHSDDCARNEARWVRVR